MNSEAWLKMSEVFQKNVPDDIRKLLIRDNVPFGMKARLGLLLYISHLSLTFSAC